MTTCLQHREAECRASLPAQKWVALVLRQNEICLCRSELLFRCRMNRLHALFFSDDLKAEDLVTYLQSSDFVETNIVTLETPESANVVFSLFFHVE